MDIISAKVGTDYVKHHKTIEVLVQAYQARCPVWHSLAETVPFLFLVISYIFHFNITVFSRPKMNTFGHVSGDIYQI